MVVLDASAIMLFGLERAVTGVWPGTEVVRVSRIAEAAPHVSAGSADLLITGMLAADGDVFDLLLSLRQFSSRVPATLVVATDCKYRPLRLLDQWGIAGAFDANQEGLDRLHEAIATVASGRRYWSPTLWDRLHGKSDPMATLARMLTPGEERVLAAIGDGSDDAAAAALLRVKDSAVHSMRRSLHRKLNVQNRTGLIQAAVQYGVVRFTDAGVVRPGFVLAAQAEKKGLRESPAE